MGVLFAQACHRAKGRLKPFVGVDVPKAGEQERRGGNAEPRTGGGAVGGRRHGHAHGCNAYWQGGRTVRDLLRHILAVTDDGAGVCQYWLDTGVVEGGGCEAAPDHQLGDVLAVGTIAVCHGTHIVLHIALYVGGIPQHKMMQYEVVQDDHPRQALRHRPDGGVGGAVAHVVDNAGVGGAAVVVWQAAERAHGQVVQQGGIGWAQAIIVVDREVAVAGKVGDEFLGVVCDACGGGGKRRAERHTRGRDDRGRCAVHKLSLKAESQHKLTTGGYYGTILCSAQPH